MEISNWISCSWFYFAVPILSLQFIDGGSRWMDGYVNGWVDGCVDGWLDGCKELLKYRILKLVYGGVFWYSKLS